MCTSIAVDIFKFKVIKKKAPSINIPCYVSTLSPIWFLCSICTCASSLRKLWRLKIASQKSVTTGQPSLPPPISTQGDFTKRHAWGERSACMLQVYSSSWHCLYCNVKFIALERLYMKASKLAEDLSFYRCTSEFIMPTNECNGYQQEILQFTNDNAPSNYVTRGSAGAWGLIDCCAERSTSTSDVRGPWMQNIPVTL